MEWYEWLLIVVVGGALFGSRAFRLIVGYRCPRCYRSRMERVCMIHETFTGMHSLWICPHCDARFLQRGWGSVEPDRRVSD
jgi:hypothetical protein